MMFLLSVLPLIGLLAGYSLVQFFKPFYLHWRYKKMHRKLYDEDF